MKKPKILYYDIETTPLISYTWDRYLDGPVIGVKQDWQLLCISWKWEGEKVQVKGRIDYKDKSDKTLTSLLWDLLNEADIVITHNGDSFDNKKAAAKFIEHGLIPPADYSSIDTCKAAKRFFKFSSNRLNELGVLLGLGKKVETGGFSLWLDCIAGIPKAWALMKKYNKQDVLLLEKVYKKLRPYITNHPNLAHISGKPSACPTCQSTNLQSNGVRRTKTLSYTRYRCMDCGSSCRARTNIKDSVKPDFVGV